MNTYQRNQISSFNKPTFHEKKNETENIWTDPEKYIDLSPKILLQKKTKMSYTYEHNNVQIHKHKYANFKMFTINKIPPTHTYARSQTRAHSTHTCTHAVHTQHPHAHTLLPTHP